MDIIVREVTESDRETNICIDGSFIVDSALELTFLDGRMEYTVRERARYTKRYPDSRMVETVGLDYADSIDNPDQTMFLAFAGDAAVGRLNVKRNWNAYACIENLAVDREYRRYGIGRRLMELAILGPRARACRESCWRRKIITSRHAAFTKAADLQLAASIASCIKASTARRMRSRYSGIKCFNPSTTPDAWI